MSMENLGGPIQIIGIYSVNLLNLTRARYHCLRISVQFLNCEWNQMPFAVEPIPRCRMGLIRLLGPCLHNLMKQ